jgi:hypothetical protein
MGHPSNGLMAISGVARPQGERHADIFYSIPYIESCCNVTLSTSSPGSFNRPVQGWPPIEYRGLGEALKQCEIFIPFGSVDAKTVKTLFQAFFLLIK